MALRKASCSLGVSLSRTRASGLAAPSSHSPIWAAWAGGDLDDRAPPVGRVGVSFDEACPVKVGEHAADGGQGQAEPGGQLADGDRAAAELLERCDVARAQRRGHGRRGAVLPAAHSPGHPGEQLHQAQAKRGVAGGARLVSHGPPLMRPVLTTQSPVYMVPLSK